jgi:hypothetical protein
MTIHKSPEMESFLRELHELLNKHEATIVRSSSNETELVVSMQVAFDFHEFAFLDEIGMETIVMDYFGGLEGFSSYNRENTPCE